MPPTTICLTLLAMLLAGEAGAQVDDTHHGYWISTGGGGGWSSGRRGASWYLRMGGTPHNRVQFGGEVLAWWREEGPGNDVQRENVSLVALIYPLYPSDAASGLFREWWLKIGWGIGVGEFAFAGDGEGVGLTAGTGFHFRLGRKFFVSPGFDFVLQFYEERTVTVALFTVGFSWH